jgi:hypothetical protein
LKNNAALSNSNGFMPIVFSYGDDSMSKPSRCMEDVHAKRYQLNDFTRLFVPGVAAAVAVALRNLLCRCWFKIKLDHAQVVCDTRIATPWHIPRLFRFAQIGRQNASHKHAYGSLP